MTLDRFFDDEYLVKAWDGCETSKIYARELIAISRHESFFIRILVDTRTYEDTSVDMGVLEEMISNNIDDIAEQDEFKNCLAMDMPWKIIEHDDYKALQRRLEFIGMQITLVDSKVEFGHEEDRELLEVGHAYRMGLF